jgi:hypothetical protein
MKIIKKIAKNRFLPRNLSIKLRNRLSSDIVEAEILIRTIRVNRSGVNPDSEAFDSEYVFFSNF